jgi:hypothetical protein
VSALTSCRHAEIESQLESAPGRHRVCRSAGLDLKSLWRGGTALAAEGGRLSHGLDQQLALRVQTELPGQRLRSVPRDWRQSLRCVVRATAVICGSRFTRVSQRVAIGLRRWQERRTLVAHVTPPLR